MEQKINLQKGATDDSVTLKAYFPTQKLPVEECSHFEELHQRDFHGRHDTCKLDLTLTFPSQDRPRQFFLASALALLLQKA